MSKSALEFRQGVIDIFPVIAAASVIGLLWGTLAASKGLSPLETGLMSASIFAGAAQFVAIELWQDPAPWFFLTMTVLIVNVRHVLMGASLSRHMGNIPSGWRAPLLYMMADENWAFSERRALTQPLTLAYYLGLSLPMVTVSQIFTVDAASLARSVPRPDRMEEDAFRSALQDVLAPVMQTSDNVGANDEHRAINYLTARYPALYARIAEAYAVGSPLAAVDVSPSRLTGSRRIVSVVYACVSRTTGAADRFFARVDVTEQFPFLVTGLSPYFDR